MNNNVTIVGGLAGLNEMIDTARRNRYESAKQKKKYTRLVEKELKAQGCIPDKPYDALGVTSVWIESGRARDPDNIRVGIKYVLDAMVNTGVITNDSMKHIKFLKDTFEKGEKRKVFISWVEIKEEI